MRRPKTARLVIDHKLTSIDISAAVALLLLPCSFSSVSRASLAGLLTRDVSAAPSFGSRA